MKRTVIAISLLAALLPTRVLAHDLADVFHLALKNDAQLAAAASRRRARLENKPQARALLLPQISANASYTRYRDHIISQGREFNNNGAGGSNSFFNIPTKQIYGEPSASASLTQPIFDWNAWSQLEQADATTAQAEAQFQAAKQSLLIRVSNAYFNLLQAKDNLRFALAQKSAIAHQLDQAKERYNVGTAANTALQNARASFDQARASVIQAKSRVRNMREALRVITGVMPTRIQPVRKNIPLSAPDPSAPKAWVHIAMNGNLQVKRDTIQTHIDRKQIDIAQSGHYPTLNFVAGYSYFDSSDSYTGQEQTETSYGVQINIPIFSGGAVSSRVRQARDRYEQSTHQLTQTRRQVVANTRNDYSNVVLGVSRVKSLKQGVKSARVSLQATKSGYQVGTRTEVDVLNALQTLYQAQQNYAQARYAYLENLLQLKQDAGSLGPSDLLAVDRLIVSKNTERHSPAPGRNSSTSRRGG